MSLQEYLRKRDFTRTREPKGRVAKGGREPIFVIQKHDASRLHYDFRLEMGGTLKSWAVPKGLPYAKGEKHLAVEVEDHPLEYGKFEGIIPKGQYGGGTVMLWDTGTYVPGGPDSLKAWKEGRLHFFLHGKKVQGEWSLVRMHGEEHQWLLLKSGEGLKPLSTRRDDRSAVSQRTMHQIAKAGDAVWQSHPQDESTEPSPRRPSLRSRLAARRATPPAQPQARGRLSFIEPMKARLAAAPPSLGDWIYELKFDGYRALALKYGGNVELFSRNGNDLGARFPEVVEALRAIPVDIAVLDGEIVALDKRGHSSFQLLQGQETGLQAPPIVYYLFDLLRENGKDLQHEPLHHRKQKLEALLHDIKDPLRFSHNLEADPQRLLREIKKLGLEGLIGKQRNSPYEAGRRSGAWLKLKCVCEQEFVVGGFTPPAGTRERFGALLVGYHEKGKLVFCGKVGTGFDHALLKSLHDRMAALETKKCPFSNLPEAKAAGRWTHRLTSAEFRKCHWIKPKLVAQIKFAEWTSDGKLRQPVFLGLREDKAASEVRRERPTG